MSGDMGKRGVTRPMAQMSEGEHESHGPPYSDARYKMLEKHHSQTLWVYWTLILLGVWLLLSPSAFGYLNEANWKNPSGGRGVWFSDQLHTSLRAWLMTWSDLLSGALLVFFGWRSLRPNRPVSLWLACGVGAWLSCAPVFFWAPTVAAYVNDSIVGMLVITLTILIPGMPNMALYMRMGGSQPPGWSYNPSSWAQRWIMIVGGFLGLIVSRYLGMFQLGYIDQIWDPFFGDSTRKVLNSSMSHSFPVSDASLGALAYTFEFLMGYMGSPARWRTMPWMVAFFGILVIPLGLVHIFLVISQPVMVGYWCTFCLLAAGIMLPMIPLEVDEVIAMLQHVKRARKKGQRFLTVFFKGGEGDEATEDERSPAMDEFAEKPGRVFLASIWGMSFPLTLVAATAIGIFAMAVPGMMDTAKPAASVFHLAGSLVVVFSVVAMGEVVRATRFLNLLLGLILAVGPWILDGAGTTTAILGTIIGAAVILLSIPRGKVKDHYGRWDRFVR